MDVYSLSFILRMSVVKFCSSVCIKISMEVIISLLYKYLRVLTFEITPVGNKKGVRAPRLA